MNLLYAEDERALSEAVCDILTYNKYLVDAVYNGTDALEYARVGEYDGIILDIMMPGMSGIEVLNTLRKEGCKTPVLLLTAKSEIEDRITGLDAGADDYLPKPFAMGELLARIRAMLRRREDFVPDNITCGDLTLERKNSVLSANGVSFTLPKLEFRMMELFIINRGIYISSEDLLTKIWGYDTDAEIGIVWVYISYLRKKLTAMNSNVEIRAKRGVGYTLDVREEKNG
ncbi:MAG: response regulator transcription factor [Clostridia bacterium]|nr:response regulator transcription factor [Clostridia bacterium]